MGKKAKEIIKMDSSKLITILNKAFADEWLAYYQYWIGAQLAKGPMKDAVVKELLEHAGDELRHTQLLSNRIIQLEGTPILTPQEWYSHTNCGYDTPNNPFVKKLLEQNIKAERCAIDVYEKIINETKDFDPITYNLALENLEDEIEHEQDLKALLEDLTLIN